MIELLWLDDVRNPYEDDWLAKYAPEYKDQTDKVHWVKNAQEFKTWILENGMPKMICFDHDLSDAEEWKPAFGYEGVYEVSSYGRVKRVKVSKGTSTGILEPDKNDSGLYVHLRNLGNDKKMLIHRLVLLSFIGTCEDKTYVNHKDGNRWNNNINNLEWCTNSENVKHSHDYLERDFTAFGENHNNSLKVSQYNKDGGYIDTYGSVNEAGRQLNIDLSNIAKCARGDRKTCGGYKWVYDDKEVTKSSVINHLVDKDYTINFFIPEIEETGYDCALWLVAYCIDNKTPLPTWVTHSFNPIGRDNINKLLTNFLKKFKNICD